MRALASTLPLALLACSAAPPSPVQPRPLPPPVAATPDTTAATPVPAQRFADVEATYSFLDPERVAKLRSAFSAIDTIGQEQLDKQGLPGLAIGVVIDRELAYMKGFGFANLEAKTPVDADTIYRIGSISKSFTAMALLSLRDEGALSLDDPLVRLVPEAASIVYLTRDEAPLTLRQLLTHTSGLPRMGSFSDTHGPSEEEVTKSLAGFQLASPPGTRWSYSNLGFSLLGIAASRAAHRPLRELVRDRLLVPLGMTSTAWDASALPAGRVATGYAREGGGPPKVAEPWRLGAAEGAGGLYASTRDMARWLAFQLDAYPPRGGADPGPVKRSTVREAHSSGYASGLWIRLESSAKKGDKAVDAIAETYGFGWITAKTCDFDALVWHNGGIDGFRSEVRFLPEQGVGIIVLINSAEADAEAISTRVTKALLKTGGLAPRVPALSAAFAPAVGRLLGVINAWDEAAYAAMLTRERKPYPDEKNELAGYRDRHGPCQGWKPVEITSPRTARLALSCAKGALDMTVSLGSDGLIAGFSGVSRDVSIADDERKVAAAIARLIDRWDEALYKKHLAHAFPRHAEVVEFYDHLREGHGACSVKSAEQTHTNRTILLSCERGRDLRLSLTLDAQDRSAVARYTVRNASSGGVCPVR